ncbi:cytochrome P450 [Zychaea mexicana]|uniref:cytochrome P450 n=1 Tax=Zychaea mexicana TaxID=64656 RepID=UPI0022FE27EB|nr:cytochrome P450 [Zychaea mexicana]KAI9490543.1 cytochrome P450 [Zychaea mexicana]
MFFTADKRFHRQRRRIISPAFSVKYLNSLEIYMLSANEAFVQRIDKDIKRTNNLTTGGYGEVDIWKLLNYLILDIIGETAFGQTFELLEKDNDHIVPRTVSRTIETISYFMEKIIMDRLQGGEKARRNDILQILIDSQKSTNKHDRLTVDAIAQETIIFLVAGSETTSNTIGFALIELLRNPHAFVALRKEIDSVQQQSDGSAALGTLLCHKELKSLPYLNAVIYESMRLNFIAPSGMERRADKDMVLGGRVFVPQGTFIQCNPYGAQRDPGYWPEPSKFKPERWINGSDAPADHEAFFPFSTGSRKCIGNTFALHEMLITLANLVKLYDFRAIPAELEASNERRAFVTLTLKNRSFKVQMKRR